MKIEFYSIDNKRNPKLKYAIIVARFQFKQWLFVQHNERNTWEIPAGHIEKGESPDEAAKRELYEETGAVCYTIYPAYDYSVTQNIKKQYGRLFLAEVEKLDDLPKYEIKQILLSDSLPDNLTYPIIQPILFRKIVEIKKSHPSVDE